MASFIDRYQAELIIQALAGGNAPLVGRVPIFRENGWVFEEMTGGSGNVWINVKDAPFNAVGDGVADDTAAIQAALDDGRPVFIPEGTYLISQLQLNSYNFISGGGWNSILKAKNANHTVISSGTSTGANGARTLNNTANPFTLNGHKNFTVHITGGLGVGQKRTVTHAETTGQLAISDDWTTIPDATSTYSLYDGKHLIVLKTPATTRNTMVENLQLIGNKSNQTALVDGFYYINLGWSDANHDSMHMIHNVLVDDFSGTGLTRSTAVREMRITASRFNRCDGYGSRNLLDHTDSGASDCKFWAVVCAKNGLSGFSCGAGHDLLVDCKSFGNGLSNISGNACGYLLYIDGVHLSSCEAQENFQGGYRLLLAAKSCALSSCNSDANGGVGVTISGTTDAFVQVTVQSTPGLLYTTANALEYINSATRNTVIINAQQAQLSGALTTSGSVFDFDSLVMVNNLIRGPVNNRFGTLSGGVFNAHFLWGKEDAGAANNPIWSITTSDAASNPTSQIGSAIGATTRTFIKMDHGNNVIHLGHAAGGAPFGEVRIVPTLFTPTTNATQFGDATHRWGQAFFGEVIFNLWGSTNVARTHFQWGRDSSPASNNPSYYIKTSSHSTPRGVIEGFNGTTTRSFIEMDGESGGVTYQGVSPLFTSSSGDVTISSAGKVVVTANFDHTGSQWRLGNQGSLGASPSGYSVSNVTIDRVFDANATSLDEIADVLGTLLSDLFARGVIA